MPNWPEIFIAIEESLFAYYECDVWERSHYYYLLSQTRLKETEMATIPLSQISSELSCSEFSSRKILRRLAQKGCIELDQTRRGHSVKVLLPSELPIPQTTAEPVDTIDIEAIDFFKGRSYVQELLDRENGQCFYCLKRIDPESCELDHVIPQVARGATPFSRTAG